MAVICDDVRRELGGKLSIMGLFQEMTASKFPAVHPRFYVVIFIYGGQGTCKISISIQPPSKKPSDPEWVREITLGGGNQKHVEVVALSSVSFPEKGKYAIQIACDGQTLEATDLEILQDKN